MNLAETFNSTSDCPESEIVNIHNNFKTRYGEPDTKKVKIQDNQKPGNGRFAKDMINFRSIPRLKTKDNPGWIASGLSVKTQKVM